MNLITIEQAVTHVVEDSGDTAVLALLETYCNGAEEAVARLANRNIYGTPEALIEAQQTVPSLRQQMWAQYDAAVLQAGTADARSKAAIMSAADDALVIATTQINRIVAGMVCTPDIIDAILLIVGHWFNTREEVVTGQGAAAVQVPMAAEAIMSRHMWLGTL